MRNTPTGPDPSASARDNRDQRVARDCVRKGCNEETDLGQAASTWQAESVVAEASHISMRLEDEVRRSHGRYASGPTRTLLTCKKQRRVGESTPAGPQFEIMQRGDDGTLFTVPALHQHGATIGSPCPCGIDGR